jgi:hypothetical protein
MPPVGVGHTVEIILQLAPDAFVPSTPSGAALCRIAAAAGAVVEALHVGTDDPELASLAHVLVPAGRAEQLVTRLAASPGVAAAYVKFAGPAA